MFLKRSQVRRPQCPGDDSSGDFTGDPLTFIWLSVRPGAEPEPEVWG